MNAVVVETAEETVARIEAELAQAIQAEEAAGVAVGEAHLTGSAPQALRDALDAACRHRSTLEAALAAAKRKAHAASHDAGQVRRRARMAAVRAAIDELEAALADIDAGLQAFAATGAGPRAHKALMKLLPLVTDASESILTPGGWVTTEHLTRLRVKRTDLIDELALEGMGSALRGDFKAGGMPMLAQAMRKRLIADLEVQPPTWATEG